MLYVTLIIEPMLIPHYEPQTENYRKDKIQEKTKRWSSQIVITYIILLKSIQTSHEYYYVLTIIEYCFSYLSSSCTLHVNNTCYTYNVSYRSG